MHDMNEPAEASTFERSCRHWSEESADEMAAFYRLATFDYALLADAADWGAELTRLSQATLGDSLSLLDVACGSGKFPSALLANASFQKYAGKPIDYHLLDPSEFSLQEAASQLSPPFRARKAFHCTLQDLGVQDSGVAQDPDQVPGHDMVWATHALYCVPAEELPIAAARFCAAMRPGGLGFVAHATDKSHYLRFHQLYLEHWTGATGVPFCTADQVAAALQAEGTRAYGADWRWEESTIDYEGTLELEDTRTAEMYLQRCLFDDSVTLDQMLGNAAIREYLLGMQDQAAGLWRFPQQASLMRFGIAASA